jgi:hypothetical protein
MGYASTYRRYSVLELRAGALVAERKINRAEYEAFRQSQFEKFKQTNAYKDLMKEHDYEERFIFEFSSEVFTTTIYEDGPGPSVPLQ